MTDRRWSGSPTITPLAESAIAGVGIGAAMYGMRPIAEMQFADFIMPAVNQIISEAARIRYRSNNDWNCPIVVRAPFGGGVHGGGEDGVEPSAHHLGDERRLLPQWQDLRAVAYPHAGDVGDLRRHQRHCPCRGLFVHRSRLPFRPLSVSQTRTTVNPKRLEELRFLAFLSCRPDPGRRTSKRRR